MPTDATFEAAGNKAKQIPLSVDRDVVDDFLSKIGLDPSDHVRQVTIIPGGIEVVQTRKRGYGSAATSMLYGCDSLATVTTQIEVKRPSKSECAHWFQVTVGIDEQARTVTQECYICGGSFDRPMTNAPSS